MHSEERIVVKEIVIVRIRSTMMEVQQQHSPVGVGPLDFSRRGVAEASAFRVVKPKQSASSLVHQQALSPETNNNENLQENPQVPVEADGKRFSRDRRSNFIDSAVSRREFERQIDREKKENYLLKLISSI